ncbi:hypothetical protein JST97_09610 [bacterium]|nr:hypothetical protein [bacterium]
MSIHQIASARPAAGLRCSQAGARQSPELNPGPESGGDEVSLKVTPSMMNAVEFQTELAKYAQAGIRFDVEMVPEGSFTLPTPPDHATKLQTMNATATRPAGVQKLIQCTGAAGAALGSALCAGLGALGGAFVVDTIVDKIGPTTYQLAHQGALNLLVSGLLDSSVLTKFCILASGVACGVGGAILGQALGKIVASAIADPDSLAGKVRPKLNSLVSTVNKPDPALLSCQVGILTGAVGGYIAGGTLGALAVGTAGAVGAYQTTKWLSKTASSLLAP